jgi:hypothetical protein
MLLEFDIGSLEETAFVAILIRAIDFARARPSRFLDDIAKAAASVVFGSLIFGRFE